MNVLVKCLSITRRSGIPGQIRHVSNGGYVSSGDTKDQLVLGLPPAQALRLLISNDLDSHSGFDNETLKGKLIEEAGSVIQDAVSNEHKSKVDPDLLMNLRASIINNRAIFQTYHQDAIVRADNVVFSAITNLKIKENHQSSAEEVIIFALLFPHFQDIISHLNRILHANHRLTETSFESRTRTSLAKDQFMRDQQVIRENSVNMEKLLAKGALHVANMTFQRNQNRWKLTHLSLVANRQLSLFQRTKNEKLLEWHLDRYRNSRTQLHQPDVSKAILRMLFMCYTLCYLAIIMFCYLLYLTTKLYTSETGKKPMQALMLRWMEKGK